jgi:putative transcriptional regulator
MNMDEKHPPVIDNLTGSFLLSTPKMPDPRFMEQVILICAHGQEGAMGVAVNKPHESLRVSDILNSSKLPLPDGPLPPVYIGGPVDLEAAFILYGNDFDTDNKVEISEHLAISREIKLLEEISRGHGPKQYLLILGYAGWGPGQLEAELVADGWLSLPGDEQIIFQVEDDLKWQRAAIAYGIDIATFGDVVGTA